MHFLAHVDGYKSLDLLLMLKVACISWLKSGIFYSHDCICSSRFRSMEFSTTCFFFSNFAKKQYSVLRVADHYLQLVVIMKQLNKNIKERGERNRRKERKEAKNEIKE